MDIQQKFKATTSSRTVPVNTLTIGVSYDTETVTTKFGPTVVLTLLSNVPATTKVFLPKRYSSLFTDDEIRDIQKGNEQLSLIYLGTCPISKAFQLAIEKNNQSAAGYLKLLGNKK
jgi:hypothetical protein